MVAHALRIFLALFLAQTSAFFVPMPTSVRQGQTELFRQPCFYKDHKGKWRERIELEDLEIGQELEGHVVQELLDGKTGAKLYLDVGVGRYKTSQERWQIQTAVLRLDRKESVARKKAAKLRKKDAISVFVSRIRPRNDQLEVCLTQEEAKQYKRDIPLSSASSLKNGQELVGTVRRIEDYGVFVDVGANRPGLLHIQKVADLYDQYIDKKKGLEEAGLERGARIRVKVLSNENKRLFLDFTDDVKAEAAEESQRDSEDQKENGEEYAPPVDDENEWRAFAEASISAASEEDFEDESDDDYDEDRAIEDALGLGTY